MPPEPKSKPTGIEPKIIFQLRTEDQLTEELAGLRPDYLYLPAAVMAGNYERIRPFVEKGVVPVAVLPRIVTDDEVRPLYDILKRLHELGVNEALVGNLGQIVLARSAGFQLRGDFGLNAFNSYSLQVLQEAGFLSATASFELHMKQIRDLAKPLDVEAIIYGRLPLMISEQNLLKNITGRSKVLPGELADRSGAVFPVVSETGDRTVIYNAHKLYYADKKEELYEAGLWGLRLMFTTESARECLEVAKGHLGLSDYKPNMLTRGLYTRTV